MDQQKTKVQSWCILDFSGIVFYFWGTTRMFGVDLITPPPAPAPILHSVPQRFLNKLAKIKNLVFLIRPVVTFYCHQTAIENTFALNLIFLGE